jgi:uncharacterized protein YycO
MIKLPKSLIELTAHIYLHKYPFFFLYKPQLHRVKGHQIREIINLIEPGDIFLRSFKGYLNTILVNGWGHAALYVGNDTIIHSVGEGTIKEDILDFCRCDEITVLRPKCSQTVKDEAIKEIFLLLGSQYDFNFFRGDKKYYCSELIDAAYNGLFAKDFVKFLDRMIITPDGIFKSDKVEIIYNSRLS